MESYKKGIPFSSSYERLHLFFCEKSSEERESVFSARSKRWSECSGCPNAITNERDAIFALLFLCVCLCEVWSFHAGVIYIYIKT